MINESNLFCVSWQHQSGSNLISPLEQIYLPVACFKSKLSNGIDISIVAYNRLWIKYMQSSIHEYN